ncbi:hypothetical protein QBC33DRAFT_463070, partial [Phialemonium atrogriseum]
IELFVYLPKYLFLICKCGIRCVAGKIVGHLQAKHKSIKPSKRLRIAELISQILDITRT